MTATRLRIVICTPYNAAWLGLCLLATAGLAPSQTVSIEGQITGEDGLPIRDAIIRISHASGRDTKPQVQFRPSKTGEYFATGFKPGDLRLTIELAGVVSEPVGVIRATGEGTRRVLDIDLRRSRWREEDERDQRDSKPVERPAAGRTTEMGTGGNVELAGHVFGRATGRLTVCSTSPLVLITSAQQKVAPDWARRYAETVSANLVEHMTSLLRRRGFIVSSGQRAGRPPCQADSPAAPGGGLAGKDAKVNLHVAIGVLVNRREQLMLPPAVDGLHIVATLTHAASNSSVVSQTQYRRPVGSRGGARVTWYVYEEDESALLDRAAHNAVESLFGVPRAQSGSGRGVVCVCREANTPASLNIAGAHLKLQPVQCVAIDVDDGDRRMLSYNPDGSFHELALNVERGKSYFVRSTYSFRGERAALMTNEEGAARLARMQVFPVCLSR